MDKISYFIHNGSQAEGETFRSRRKIEPDKGAPKGALISGPYSGDPFWFKRKPLLVSSQFPMYRASGADKMRKANPKTSDIFPVAKNHQTPSRISLLRDTTIPPYGTKTSKTMVQPFGATVKPLGASSSLKPQDLQLVTLQLKSNHFVIINYNRINTARRISCKLAPEIKITTPLPKKAAPKSNNPKSAFQPRKRGLE